MLAGCGHAGATSKSTADEAFATTRTASSTDAPTLAAHAADALLRRQPFPPGTVLAAHVPAWARGLLDRPPPGEVVTDSVDRYKVGLIDQPASAVLAFLSIHAPAGGRLLRTGSLVRRRRTYYRYVTYELPSPLHELGPQRLSEALAIVRRHALVLRVDAQVVWRVPRPVSSFVPAGARYLTAVVAQPAKPGGHTMGTPAGAPLHVAGERRVAQAVDALDALPLAQRGGPPPSCPPQDGQLYLWLRLRTSAHGRELAQVQVDPYDCGVATVWIDVLGHAPIALAGAPSVIHAVERALRAKPPGLPAG